MSSITSSSGYWIIERLDETGWRVERYPDGELVIFYGEQLAKDYLDVIFNKLYIAAKKQYQEDVLLYTQKNKMYNKRRKALEQAGLWKKKNEIVDPIVPPVAPIPKYPSKDDFRVVQRLWVMT